MSFLRVTRRLLSSKVSTAANAVPLALASGAVLVGGYYLADFLYKDKYVSGAPAAHTMAHKLASDHDELEIKLGSPIRLFNSIGEMREYYKENSNRVFAFNPPTVDFTSNNETEKGYRFTFFAKGPNTGFAGRKCAMIHACIINDDENLKWKYLISEFYDIADVHRDHRQQIATPRNLYQPEEELLED